MGVCLQAHICVHRVVFRGQLSFHHIGEGLLVPQSCWFANCVVSPRAREGGVLSWTPITLLVFLSDSVPAAHTCPEAFQCLLCPHAG